MPNRRTRNSAFVAAILAFMPTVLLSLPIPVGAQTAGSGGVGSASKAVPAGRAAKNVAVITIRTGDEAIDKWTAFGVERRLRRAVADGADAIVFDLDTPGGELGACLKICSLIKSCPVTNTVAWINPDAYSAGAIIALACREIVVSDAATFGDALPIARTRILQQLQTLPEDEREKAIGPLLAEVVDSARRSGHDEMLVQGVVRRGVELWLIEHKQTGERVFVTEREYRLAVGEEPTRDAPVIPSATSAQGKALPGTERAAAEGAVDPTDVPADPATAYRPAAPGTTAALAREVNADLEIRGARSQRPHFGDAEHAGQYRPLEYVADGHGLVVLKSAEMLRFGVARDRINNDDELKAFFGASTVSRINESWSIGLVRFLTNPITRGLLLVIFLVALFVEMTHPGVALPGAIAGIALLSLLVPPLLVDLAAWWGVAAVLVGIMLIGVEILLIPGFGFIGVAGIVLLFGGLIGVFVGGPSGLFPSTVRGRNELAFGATTVLISMITSVVIMYFLGKHLASMPLFNRLVLKGGAAANEESTEGLLAAMGEADGPVQVGEVGVAITPLRPAGRVEIGGRIVDVVADMGFIDAGAEVRVVAVDQFRTVVERA